MKKKLLLICSLLVSASFSDIKAQDFDMDFYTQFGGSTSNANAWKNGGTAAAITKNGISAWIETANMNRWSTNNTETGGGIPYLRFQASHDDGIIYMSSQNALRKMAFQYRGTTDAGIGNLKITYGTEPNDLFAEVKYLTPVASATAPGSTVYVDFDPAAGIKWVKIQRGTINADGTGGNVSGIKLYRIAASTIDFTTLPLNFVSFTAKTDLISNAVNLKWSTTNEVNTKEFVVERGTNAGNFKAIGTLASANTPGTHTYSFADVAGLPGKAYYRIKQVDKDGNFAYSDVEDVTLKVSFSLSAYPNPTADVLNVSHESAINASLKVFNIQGQPVISQSVASASTLSKLNVASLASGLYYVVLSNDGAQSSVKFVKN